MNGIHEVTGSIPVWSTNTPNAFSLSDLWTALALEALNRTPPLQRHADPVYGGRSIQRRNTVAHSIVCAPITTSLRW